MEYSILNKVAVRLSIDSQAVGGGIVFKNDENYYIITAAHCLKDVTNNLSIDFYNSLEKNFESEQLNDGDFEVFKPENSEIDSALIKVNKTNLIHWIAIPEIKLAANIFDKKKDFVFRGFPRAHKNLRPSNIEAVLNGEDNTFFMIKAVGDSFDDSINEPQDNVEGFSGSGVCFSANGGIYLVGVVSEFISIIKRFNVFNINWIKDLLPKVKVYQKEDIQFEYLDVALLCDFKRQLSESENYIHNFKPLTALSELEKLLEAINNSSLPIKEKEELIAEYYYLKGVALILLEDSGSDASELLINAYLNQPKKVKYIERAAIAYFNLGDQENAKKLIKEVLEKDSFNARIWALKNHIEKEIIKVPIIVKQKPRFIYNTFIHRIRGKKIAFLEDINKSFNHIPITIEVPTLEQINYDNFQYYLFLGIYFLSEDNEKIRVKSFTRVIKPISIREKKGAEILEILWEKLSRTEVEDTNLIQQAEFYYELSKYKLKPSKMAAMRLANLFMENELISRTLLKVHDIVFALLDFELNEEIIEVIEKSEIEREISNFYVLRAESLEKINKKEEAKIFYEKFIAEVSKVDIAELQNLLLSINALQRLQTDVASFYSIIQKKTFQQHYALNLIEGCLFRYNPDKRDYCLGKAKNLEDHWDELHFNFKIIVISIYCAFGEINKGVELFKPLIESKENEEKLIFYLPQYIELLWISKKYSNELLQKLKYWKENYPSQSQFLLYEIQLYQKIDNYHKVEEVAKEGVDKFKNNNEFKFILIDVLYKQKKSDELDSYLNESILDFDLLSGNMLYLAQVCVQNRKVELGLEIALRELKKHPSNIDIKMGYWRVFNLIKEENWPKQPDTIDFNTVVELEINSEIKFYEISRDSFNSNSVIRKIFSKKTSDVIDYKDRFHKSRIKIINVFDKYLGQIKIILNETNEPLSGGMPVKSLPILDENGEFDIERFHTKVQDLFGQDGFLRKSQNEKVMEKYINREIGFSELCNSLFGGNYFECFDSIVNQQILGFNICPLIFQNSFQISKETEFVLDFSSILLFQRLSKSVDFNSYKLYISQSTKDIIIKEIYELSHAPQEKMALSILPDRVVPIFYPENYSQNKLAKISEILEWVNENCIIDYIDFNLNNEDFVDKLSDELDKKYLTHTLLLASKSNRMLISDDLLFYNKPFIPFITSENFFRQFNFRVWEEAKLEMIGLNYKGITLTRNTLYASFEKSRIFIKNQQNYFQNAIKSLEGRHNPNLRNVQESMYFIKDIFSINTELPVRIYITKQIFISIFKEPYSDIIISERSLSKLFGVIDNEFKLLGNSSDIVKRCLQEVLIDLGVK